MHYLMMISEYPSMMRQAELLIKTIKNFSYGKPVEFTLIIQGFHKGPASLPLPLIRISKKGSYYLGNNVEILYTPYYWELGLPCRWFVKPRCSMCVMIDVDMIACSDLSPMYELEKDKIHGAGTYTFHLSDDEWKSIGMDDSDKRFYFNMGMIVVSSDYLQKIGRGLFNIYPEIQKKFPNHAYFAGQISLSYVVKQMNIGRNLLPRKFNWIDFYDYESMKEPPIFLHYIKNRNNEKNIRSALSNNTKDLDSNYKQIFKRSLIKLI